MNTPHMKDNITITQDQIALLTASPARRIAYTPAVPPGTQSIAEKKAHGVKSSNVHLTLHFSDDEVEQRSTRILLTQIKKADVNCVWHEQLGQGYRISATKYKIKGAARYRGKSNSQKP